jgi:cytidyltransferase-like protein
MREKVVFTNGCFDLPHLSHINLLEKAQSMGGVLPIVVNSNKSLSYLKCPQRPFSEKNEEKLLFSLKFIELYSRVSAPSCGLIFW